MGYLCSTHQEGQVGVFDGDGVLLWSPLANVLGEHQKHAHFREKGRGKVQVPAEASEHGRRNHTHTMHTHDNQGANGDAGKHGEDAVLHGRNVLFQFIING
jgi:hypothetical protein